jgi:peptide/nickel transport system substrate-binding protein
LSDGTPLTADDVLTTLKTMSVGGVATPFTATAPDPQTVVLTFAAPSGPGLRLLDAIAIRQKDGNNVGIGPFLVHEKQADGRVVLERNPRYWRDGGDGDSLPYLDRVVLEVIPDVDAEVQRLLKGTIDLPARELRPQDYVTMRRAEEEGQVRLLELGVAPDADAFWFCLNPEVRGKDPRFIFVSRPEFRQAISHAVDREAFAEQVFLGAAVPVWGPITPGNERWFWPDVPRYFHDPAKARAMLAGIGLDDRNKDGVVEDSAGTEARFRVVTQQGVESYIRGTSVLRDELSRVGIAIEVDPVVAGAIVQRLGSCDYDAIYYQPGAAPFDPASNMDFWLTSGARHYWHARQKTPATEWERRIDTLILEQAASLDEDRRRQQFELVQQIFAENLPMLYFAAPRMYLAHSERLRGIVPSVVRPLGLWNADSLFVID